MAEILSFPGARSGTYPGDEIPSSLRPQPAPEAVLAADAAARTAALDVHSSCIVEAPAGSGKTGLLVQRLLKLLAHGEVAQPEEVLAMTFTRKATAEMQQRVLEQLQAAHDRVPLPSTANPFEHETRALAEAVLERSEQLGWNLAAQPQRLNIRSILSVCLEIANSLPVLSGSGGLREPVEEADARELYRLAARRTLLQLGGPDPALHNALRTILLHRDGLLGDVESLLADMLDSRDQWGALIPLDRASVDDAALDREVRPKLERALESIVCAGLSRALRALPPHLLHDLTQLAARLGDAPGYKGKPSPIALCSDKSEPPQAIADHLDHWLALIHLVLKPSDDDWRNSFNRNHIGFEASKADTADLKALVAEIRSSTIRDALRDVRNLPPTRYPDEQWAVARALFHVLRHALVELKLLFGERGQCDYTELALTAREALRRAADAQDSAPDLALSAGGRLRHMLVDEMQDTSAIQYDLIQRLTASWDGHSQTLFLVGDPKQSIYLFRQACVERFLRTLHQRRLGDVPLQPLRLTANFRSQAALVESFNHTFGGDHPAGRIFAPPVPAGGKDEPNSPGSEVPFVAAAPTRPATSAEAVVWHTAALLRASSADPDSLSADSPDAESSNEEAGDSGFVSNSVSANGLAPRNIAAADFPALEAGLIRQQIEQRLALPLPPGRSKPWTIAVLARARRHLAAIVQELKAHDGCPAIPFRAVDLDPLDDLPEVLDALALTRALLHPADRIAWLAVLHAPWCGLGLADLLALTGEASIDFKAASIDFKSASIDFNNDLSPQPEAGAGASPYCSIATLVRSRRQFLSETGRQLLDRAWPVLEAAVTTLGRTSLAVHVERTWRSLGGDAPLAPEQQTNVLRFLRVLREVEAEPGLAALDLLSVLTARLNELRAEPLAGEHIHVDLMTIHKAKGLEWDLVLVPGLHRRTSANRSSLLNWAELDGSANDEEAPILLAPIWGKGSESDQLNGWLQKLRTRRERAEEKRLFYVVSTRAREQLHLFAALDRKADGTLSAPAEGSLLKACWPAAEEHFAALEALSQPLHAEPSTFAAELTESTRAVHTFPSVLPHFTSDLALAASADGPEEGSGAEDADRVESARGSSDSAQAALHQPRLQRLPLSFDPAARFAAAAERKLPYAPAIVHSQTSGFTRPEGSFGVRAFGNVVHRYLQVLAGRLAADAPAATPSGSGFEGRPDGTLNGEASAATDARCKALLDELSGWTPRLTASLRGEGLSPADAGREAVRALRALSLTLNDPVGRWILSPHPLAASEQTLTLAAQPGADGALRAARSLRIDRTFLSGPAPLSPDPDSSGEGCIWIIDFKTTEPGSHAPEAFAADQIATYTPQLEGYARLRRDLPGGGRPIHLGLFYPLLPRLLHWPSAGNFAASSAS